MLNISTNKINHLIERKKYSALDKTEQKSSGKIMKRILIALLVILVIVCMLPWTQNIQSAGSVIALSPDQRPQTIHSVIAGRIEKWFVREGQLVEKGDTILQISEIKESYFDPQLLQRNAQQLRLKESGLTGYTGKITALDNQIYALEQSRQLKIKQAELDLQKAVLKKETDSIELEAVRINYKIAGDQLSRMQQMYEQGLKSLVDLETRQNTFQKSLAALTAAENKLLTSRNEWINAQVQLKSIDAEYRYQIAKAESDKNTALSGLYEAEAEITKLTSYNAGLEVRNTFYYITAPQQGYITQAIKSGLGELIKEGEPVVSIMPARYDLAIEMFIAPMDLPLVKTGQRVRIQFDGWPAIVFSGWPKATYGTYGGIVYAIDNFISSNGKYRALVIPDPDDQPWPSALRVGSGASSFLLLKDVPVWYELWRKINGFPPDFYQQSGKDAEQKTINHIPSPNL